MPEPLRSPDRLRLDQLEGREVPALFTALATDGLTLIGYDSDNPGAVLGKATVVGLDAGATLVGIDYRGSNSKLYGVSSDSRLYTVDPASGAATAVGGTFSTPLNGTVFGVDVNPAVDKLRIISNTNQNLRVNLDTGAIAGVDTPQAYDPVAYDQVVGGTPPTPVLVATAYTRNPPVPGSTTPVTTQYVIDGSLSLLSTQGTSSDNTGGDLVSPNTGILFPVDKLGFTAATNVAFDIQPGTDLALVAVGNKLYTVNLTTASTVTVGDLPAAAAFRDLAIQPAVTPGAGTLTVPATATFPASRGPLAVTVTRTAGSTGTVTVDFATGGGDAVAGVDYLPASGTLTFAPGEVSKQIIILLQAGPATPGPAKTFDLTLTNPTGGAALGMTATTAVTIPAVATPPFSERGKFFATGAGIGGGPRVVVYDSATGAQVGDFFAYEPSFTGGVTVAAADFNGDGIDDIVVGSGVGGGPRVRVFDGATLGSASPTVLADFFAYESSFRGGVNVAAGDITGDGIPELVAGAGVGGGPRIRVFSADTALAAFGMADPTAVNDFFAYEESFRGGVTVAVGELTGDGQADIVAGSGVGGGPRVRVFDAKVLGTGSTPAAFSDFFAYDSSFRDGVNVGTGVVAGDGTRSILTGVGTGGGPDVRAFTAAGKNLGGFFGFDQNLRGGVRVASADFGADGTDEILISSGPGGPPRVRLVTLAGAEVAAVQPFENSYLGGVFVG